MGDFMMMLNRILGTVVLAGAFMLPVAAHAQSPLDWSGFYAGVQGAVATGTVKAEETWCDTHVCGNSGTLDDSFIADYGLGGFRGGVHAGYNHQFDHFVLGAVTDLNFSKLSGDGTYTYYDGFGGVYPSNPVDSSSFTFNWEGSTRLVAGVALDDWMPYVTAGVAYGQGTLKSHRTFVTPNPEFSTGASLLGVTVGAGLNYAIAQNIVLSGEIRHTAYGSAMVDEADGLGNTTTQRVNISNTAAQIGISFKF